jgi:hypothetical protein
MATKTFASKAFPKALRLFQFEYGSNFYCYSCDHPVDP